LSDCFDTSAQHEVEPRVSAFADRTTGFGGGSNADPHKRGAHRRRHEMQAEIFIAAPGPFF
jgi:hypothetical protein